MKETQHKYIVDFTSMRKIAYKLKNTSIDANVKLGTGENNVVMDKKYYQRLVGRLIY